MRIQDNAFSLKGTPLSIGYDDEFEETLGHEVGHSMVYFRTISTGTFPIGLRHTGDTVCSNGQPVTVTHNLMNQVPLQEDIDKDTFQEFTNLSLSESIPDALNVAANGTCGIIDQVTHLRNSAQLYAGCAFAGTMNPCSTLSSLRTDARDDVDVPAVDLTILGAQEPDDRSETIFAHRVAGDVPRSLTRATVFKYLVFADLDNNPATGGTPSSLGFATAFHGAELVSLVQVTPIIIDNSVAGFTTDATVWIFSSGAFVRSSDPGISAALEAEQTIGDATDGRSTTEVGPTTVVIHIPNSVRGPRSASYRVQAKTILEVGGIVSATDVLDESADELGEIIHTAFPVFPVCSVTPDPAAALSEVTASATGLLPNQPLEVLLGTIEVARGVTDATGAATLTFQLPAVPGGNHLVTMGSVGTVLTADCIVNVQVPPECEAGTDTLAPTFTFVPPDITISACKKPRYRSGQGNRLLRRTRYERCSGGLSARHDRGDLDRNRSGRECHDGDATRYRDPWR